jgi:hypothetical protein
MGSGAMRVSVPLPTPFSVEMVERARRLALNEALFREVNERIHDVGREWAGLVADDEMDFVCECSNPNCTVHIRLSEAEYEAVRSDGTRFFVAPGHVLSEIEDVVENYESYWVVSKRDQSGELVAQLDRRRPGSVAGEPR